MSTHLATVGVKRLQWRDAICWMSVSGSVAVCSNDGVVCVCVELMNQKPSALMESTRLVARV